jgi:hypothetical protein
MHIFNKHTQHLAEGAHQFNGPCKIMKAGVFLAGGSQDPAQHGHKGAVLTFPSLTFCLSVFRFWHPSCLSLFLLAQATVMWKVRTKGRNSPVQADLHYLILDKSLSLSRSWLPQLKSGANNLFLKFGVICLNHIRNSVNQMHGTAWKAVGKPGFFGFDF